MKSITCIQKVVLYVERVSLYWNILYTQMKMPIHTSTFSVHAISVWNMAHFFASPKRCRLLTDIWLRSLFIGLHPTSWFGSPRRSTAPHSLSIYLCVCACVCLYHRIEFYVHGSVFAHTTEIGYKI